MGLTTGHEPGYRIVANPENQRVGTAAGCSTKMSVGISQGNKTEVAYYCTSTTKGIVYIERYIGRNEAGNSLGAAEDQERHGHELD